MESGIVYDVLGVGNAIVDVIANVEDQFLEENGLTKGAMALIDGSRVRALYERMPPAIERSGGSAANTIAGVASLGGSGAYFGKVNDDQLGEVFRHDLQSVGVRFDTQPLTGGPETARSLIVITPDAQRTMNTHLSATSELGPADIDADIVRASWVTYLEGYLFDKPQAKAAFRMAAHFAHGANRAVSLTLSDTFCVERHRAEFLDLVERDVDIVFANGAEAKALFQTDELSQAIDALSARCKVAVITLSEKGSIIASGSERISAGAEPVERVVDTTGAGDLYAAGFLFGYARQRPLGECQRLGSIAAAEVISHLGARPERRLADLVRAKGL